MNTSRVGFTVFQKKHDHFKIMPHLYFSHCFQSVVPEIVEVLAKDSTSVGGNATSQLSSVANNMRTFRVLRSLKMVSRFQKVRLIVLAVTKAFQVRFCWVYVNSRTPLLLTNTITYLLLSLILCRIVSILCDDAIIFVFF